MNTIINKRRYLPTSLFIFLLSITKLSSVQAQATLPTPDHIIVLIYENHAYSSIIGSSAAPYINALAADTNTALFTQSFGLIHPSQPNYFDLFAGDNQGVTSDNVPTTYPFSTPNLARQLVDAGKSFTTYSEDLPSVGFDGATSGNYARKHNPAANWVGAGSNQISSTTNQPFTVFPASGSYSSLPTVAYVIPNQVNDMHNGSGASIITIGDTWMHTNLAAYMTWALTNNSLLIVTFDEDDGSHGNQIPTIFYGPMVKGGSYAEHITHYDVLRTMEGMYGLPYAGNAATSTTITDCWRLHPASVKSVTKNKFSVYPNPVSQQLHFNYETTQSTATSLTIVDANGRLVGAHRLSNCGIIDISTYPNGTYYYTASDSIGLSSSGQFVVQH